MGRAVELVMEEADVDCKVDGEVWGGMLEDWLAVLLASALPPLVPVAQKECELEVKAEGLLVKKEAEGEAVEDICAEGRGAIGGYK